MLDWRCTSRIILPRLPLTLYTCDYLSLFDYAYSLDSDRVVYVRFLSLFWGEALGSMVVKACIIFVFLWDVVVRVKYGNTNCRPLTRWREMHSSRHGAEHCRENIIADVSLRLY